MNVAAKMQQSMCLFVYPSKTTVLHASLSRLDLAFSKLLVNNS